MKRNLKLAVALAAAVVIILSSGCASTGNQQLSVDPGQITAINTQKLSTGFKRQGIKVEWSCKWFTGVTETTCVKGDINAIEVSAYATSNGNSENNRETAFLVAGDKAKAKLRHFINEDVFSSRTTNTMSKNLEKATDRIKAKIKLTDEVEMSDEDAAKDTNYSVRENTNDTVRTVIENVRVQASGILRGVKTVDEHIVDRQTVSVTIRWDKDSESAANYFSKRFSK